MPQVYGELRRLAAHYMQQERGDHTLQPTALVHEAYPRLVGQADRNWQNRGHFFAVAAQAMRGILVDYARANLAQKRGGGQVRIEVNDAELKLAFPEPQYFLALDELLIAVGRNRSAFCPRSRVALVCRPQRGRNRAGSRSL